MLMLKPYHRLRRVLSLVGALSFGVMSGTALAADRMEPDASTVRTTQQGELIGAKGPDDSDVWYSVPYARPPVGELRWRAPQPPTPWKETRSAVERSKPCMQVVEWPGVGYPEPKGAIIGQEDCLYLSIWSPRLKKEEISATDPRLPVMIWIHGGGNIAGHGAEYTGAHLAASQRVIVVSVNYRLNFLGWMSHRALRGADTTEEDRSGNFGTLDHISALSWVRDNIAAFAGDPHNVTIFGESGGGQDVRALLQSPRARGLFHRAIVQSTAAYQLVSPAHAENFVADTVQGHPLSSNEILISLLMAEGKAKDVRGACARIGAMSEVEMAAYLRKKSYPELLQSVERTKTRNANIASAEAETMWVRHTTPKMYDDGVVIARGWHNDVPIMIGSTRYEDRAFLSSDPKFVSSASGHATLIDKPRYQMLSDYLGKFWKAKGVDERADDFTRWGSSVYAYRFDWHDLVAPPAEAEFVEINGAAHGSEVPLVFGTLDLGREMSGLRASYDEHAGSSYRQLSRDMMSYWARFAYAGDPAHGRRGDLPQWKPWGAGQFMILTSTADGGLRMSSERVTKAGVIEQINGDPRLEKRELKCRFIADLQGYFLTNLTEDDYQKLGLRECDAMVGRSTRSKG